MDLTTGTTNTFVGADSGANMTTGSANTFVGHYHGNQHGLDLRTSSNNIVLSDGAGNPVFYISDAGGSPRARVGINADTTYDEAALKVERNETDHLTCISTRHNSTTSRFHNSFYNSSGIQGNITVNSGSVSYNSTSDYRKKENVNYNWDGTTELKKLKPAKFNFINEKDTIQGFLAHEVSEVVPLAVTGEKDQVNKDGEPEYQSMDASKLVPLLVKTIQELEARIAKLEGE